MQKTILRKEYESIMTVYSVTIDVPDELENATAEEIWDTLELQDEAELVREKTSPNGEEIEFE
jgi:hypothetical protein